jgi:hypothetical protein
MKRKAFNINVSFDILQVDDNVCFSSFTSDRTLRSVRRKSIASCMTFSKACVCFVRRALRHPGVEAIALATFLLLRSINSTSIRPAMKNRSLRFLYIHIIAIDGIVRHDRTYENIRHFLCWSGRLRLDILY